MEKMPTTKCPVWLIDSFTKIPFRGNPVGVCFVETFPDDCIMQKIALELHWSEIAFVQRAGENRLLQKPSESNSVNHFYIRWFSLHDEAPICCHATLAAMHFLCESGIVHGQSAVFESRIGEIHVRRKKGTVSMGFPAYPLSVCTDHALLQKLEQALCTSNILSVYMDALMYVVILKRECNVRWCAPDFELIKKLNCRFVTITAEACGGYYCCYMDYDFVSRCFAPKVGIPEIPVCGASHCRLAPLWDGMLQYKKRRTRQYSGRDEDVVFLYNEKYGTVEISGDAVTILKGEIEI
jgi:PhzF family phenazine biosynthesis protein